MLPGVAVLRMRTASAFLRPASSLDGHIETAAHEGAFDAAQLLAVEEDFGLPVDAVEVEPDFSPENAGGTENSLRYQKSA